MTDVETKVFTSTEIAWGHTPYTDTSYQRRYITQRGGPGQIENDVDSFDFHGCEHEKFDRVGNSLNSPGHE